MGHTLYKYCEVNEYTKDNLENNQLFFNAPENYNDPYEGIFNFHVESEDLAHKLLKVFYQHEYDNLIRSKESVETLIRHTQIEYMNQFLNKAKICCMSYINDSILMWAHYSKNHEGICIEFDTEEMLFKIGSKVNYSNEIYKFVISNIEDIKEEKILEKYWELVTTKYLHWQYEQEYRIFSMTGNCKVKYNPESLKAVYFGLRCNQENISTVRSILRDFKHVRFYQADLKINSYKMRFIDCT